MKRLVIALCVVGTAAAGPDPVGARRQTARQLEQGFQSAATLAAQLADPVEIGGLDLVTAACNKRFAGKPHRSSGADRAALYDCIAPLMGHVKQTDDDTTYELRYGDHFLAELTVKDARIQRIAAYRANADDAAFATQMFRKSGFVPSAAVIAELGHKPGRAVVKLCPKPDGTVTTRRLVTYDGSATLGREALAFYSQVTTIPAGRCAIGIEYANLPPPPPPPPLSSTPPAPPAPPVPGSRIVAPATLETYRIAGIQAIEPEPVTKVNMQRAGKDRIVGSYKLCLDTTGKPVSVSKVRTSGDDAYDDLVRTTIAKDWRYKPFEVDGKAVPVCTVVTFIYKQS